MLPREDDSAAVRVADAAMLLLQHDESCLLWACLMRDGCPERERLMDVLNDAVNDYAKQTRVAA